MSANLTGPHTLSQLSGVSTWQGMVYGTAGCGKTCFATTSQYPTFVFDVDNGMETSLSYRVKNGMSLDNVTRWLIKSVADYDEAEKWLVANMRRFPIVVIDSLTELERIVINEIAQKSNKMSPTQEGWGVVRTWMERLSLRMRYWPCNTIVTGHEINRFSADHGREVWRPSFDGRYSWEYRKHLSFITRMEIVLMPTGAKYADGSAEMSVVRALNFGPSPFMDFKDRSGSMATYEWPHLDTILQRMTMSTMIQAVQQQIAVQPQIAP